MPSAFLGGKVDLNGLSERSDAPFSGWLEVKTLHEGRVGPGTCFAVRPLFMTSKNSRLWLLVWPLSVTTAYSAAIQNLTFTDIVKDVMVINAATKQETPAKAGDILVPPNVLKTGPDSRAELISEDKTVTRVGANTIFSVEADSRDVNIAQGSVLFNSPKGKGGGRIKSAGATASVLGTTLIVGANQSGGFKVMLLEGKGQVDGAKGGSSKLSPGQMSFALPGQAPTRPLNFELKGQVGGSKLVGGFSKPLASIAKIEAAIAVQQAKIADGSLGNTGLLIGDRPDTAFKVDLATLQSVIDSVIARIIEQAMVDAETRTPSRDVLDPRYITAVARSLSLSTTVAPEEAIFSIDGSGVTPEGYGSPSNVPGNRQIGGTISALIARNITLTLNPLDPTTPNFFLHSPVVDRDSGAIVAINDISLSGSIDMAGFDRVITAPDGTQLGTPLLISAGHTLNFTPGSLLRAATSLLEIYAGGSSFSADAALTQQLAAVYDPLVLDRVSIVNEWPLESEVANGVIRIKAPAMDLKDVAIRAGQVILESAGDITIHSGGFTGTLTTTAGVSRVTLNSASDLSGLAVGQRITGPGIAADTTITAINGSVLTLSTQASADGASVTLFSPVPLGVSSPQDLAIKGYTVSITSSARAVSLSGVPIYTNNGILRAGSTLSLNNVTLGTMDVQADQTLAATAQTDLSVLNSSLTYLVSSTFNATAGNITFTNSEIGASNVAVDAMDSAAAVRTSFAATAARAMLLTNTPIHADTVELFGGTDVTVANVSVIEPTDSPNGHFYATATTGNVSIANSVVNTYAVRLTAGGDVAVQNSVFNAPSSTVGSTFTATAANQITLNNVSLAAAQTVALDATTVVLKDVAFMANSYVSLKSGQAKVAANPGVSSDLSSVQRGYVNILSGVRYGTVDVVLPSTPNMDQAAFRAAATAAGKDFSRISIGQH